MKIPRRIKSQAQLVGGKSLDEQIADIFQEIQNTIGDIEDDDLREQWEDSVSDFLRQGTFDPLMKVAKWRRKVVPLDEFLFGKAYLGQRENEVYPGILDALNQLDTDRYDEVVEKGAIGIGKTTLANLAMARDLFKISCMRSPHHTYGIGTGTPIVFTIQSVRLSTAKKVVFEEFGRYIRNSPYFKTKYPFDRLITSSMQFREQNVQIMPLSSSGSAAISMNVIGGQMDEANFMQKTLKSKSSNADAEGNFDQAKNLYNTLASRRKSRFVFREDLPGALYLISSSRFPDDFTEIKAAEAASRGGTDERIFVFEGSQWSIKGRDKFSAEEFTVQLGNQTWPTKIIPRDIDTGEDLEPVAPGCDSIRVPMTFHKDFERDPDGALRDLAGLTTLSTRPFITQREKIQEAFDVAAENGYQNPMHLEQAEFSMGLPDLDTRYTRTDIKTERHAHIDLGISKDAAGIAVGHLAGHKVTERKNDKGTKDTEIMPVIGFDVILRVVPPMGGEIQLEDVRKFLMRLNSRYKLNITSVSFDGFQSIDSRQLLRKAGLRASYHSVEKIEPWRSFRDALYDGRILMFQHQRLNTELADAERVITNNRERVDHRPNGTKDVADAVVGVASYLLNRRANWTSPAYTGGRTGLFLFGSKEAAAKKEALSSGIGSNRPLGTRKSSNRKGIKRRPVNRR